MQTQLNNNPCDPLNVLRQEANSENPIYGLEFIVDELQDKTDVSKSQKDEQTTLDWFGLSDLCI